MYDVVAVVADGANPFELAVACEVFGIDRSDLAVSTSFFLGHWDRQEALVALGIRV